jgi:GT2 family glycosyltransferase
VKKIVLFGMMSNKPVAGIAHLTMPYVVGLERLGYEAYYVEAHGSWPTQVQDPDDTTGDGSLEAVAYIERVVRSFGFEGRWAYHALHSNGACYGMSLAELRRLYKTADLFLNLHGGTCPPDELAGDDRLVLIDTDPVGLQIDACQGKTDALELLDGHAAFFSWGENLGNEDCGVPMPSGLRFRPTRVPVLLDLWRSGEPPRAAFTTIGNWRQEGEDLEFEGETYHWSKHHEFLKFLQLPTRTEQPFELALASYDDDVLRMLAEHGWHVRPAAEISYDLDAYQRYILGSRGEFTVAKDQNVRLRSGWFSDRSATYLASGRPVITQETGFSNALPTGEGLFGFSTMDEILAAIDEINSDYERQSAAAREIAREHFDAEKVLSRLLKEVGLAPFPPSLVLSPSSRWPTTLPEKTLRAVEESPPLEPRTVWKPRFSIVVVTFDNLAFTRLCLETVLANTKRRDYELIVVDNGSTDGTVEYLHSLSEAHSGVRVIRNATNAGFAAATNKGLRQAQGDVLVLMNNDTMVAPGWLAGLARHLEDQAVGLVGPVTNRSGNEAEIDCAYSTYGEFLEFAGQERDPVVVDVPTATLFCAALRREVYDRVGPLDEGYGLGLFEDDDYAMRVRDAGYRVVLAEDVFVHHFGQATIGRPEVLESYGDAHRENRRRFEEKWGEWRPHERRRGEEYQALVGEIRQLVDEHVPQGATVAVIGNGDDELLRLNDRRAWHFPQTAEGVYAGHHPLDSRAAIDHLEEVRASGAEFLVIPQPSSWWLDFYSDFAEHLRLRYRSLSPREGACSIFDLTSTASARAVTLVGADSADGAQADV